MDAETMPPDEGGAEQAAKATEFAAVTDAGGDADAMGRGGFVDGRGNRGVGAPGDGKGPASSASVRASPGTQPSMATPGGKHR